LRVSILVAIASGFAGERVARRMGFLPIGWGWSMAAYCLAALIGFVLFVVVLTKAGK
jgi:hypothetical protein